MNPSSAKESDASLIKGATYSDGTRSWETVQQDRVLRVFLSSTFRDMQKERDEFFKSAEKLLKEHAKSKDLILVFIDLRWGLTNEVSNNGLVVVSCLESIDKCPYFLCILGSRYGWIPNHENPKEWHVETDAKYSFLTKMRGLSVTDYEIVHGALKENPVARRVFFFSRDEEYAVKHVAENNSVRELYRPSNLEDGQRQNALKERISARYAIKPYKTPQALVSMVTKVLLECIDTDFATSQTKNAEDQAHDQFMRHRLAGLEGRDALILQLKNQVKIQLENDNTEITVLGAESGIGKSSIMCGLVRDINALSASEHLVIYHFVGCSNMSNYVENIMERVVRILYEKGVLNFPPDSEEAKALSKNGFANLLQTASEKTKTPIVVVIDAVNQLVSTQEYPNVHQLNWVPKKTPKNVALVVSTIDQHESCTAARSSVSRIIPVSKLDDDGILQATHSFLTRYNKSLTPGQLSTIVEDRENTGHPLYLRIVLDELRIFGVYERVNFELAQLLSTNGVVELYSLILQRWESKYDVNIVRLSCCVLFVSHIGLSENELDKYVEYRLKKAGRPFQVATWKSFLFVLLESLYVRNGRYTFFHQLVSQSIKQYYFENEEYYAEEVEQYGLWLYNEYEKLPIGGNEISEICRTLALSKQHEILVGFLKREKVVTEMLGGLHRYDFFEYWRLLNENGYDHMSAYVDMAKQLTSAGSMLTKYFQEQQENRFLIPVLEHRISIEQGDESKVREYNILGHALNQSARYEEAISTLNKAIQIGTHLFRDMRSSTADSYNNLGNVYENLGNYEKALEFYQDSMKIRMHLYGELHTDVAHSYNNIGMIHKIMGRCDTALDCYQKSLQISMKLFGECHPEVAASYGRIGAVYMNLDMNKEALENQEVSLRIRLKVFGPNHNEVATSYGNIASIYDNLERYDKALENYQKSLDIKIKNLGEEHPSLAMSYNNIGVVYKNLKKFDQALVHYGKALDLQVKSYGKEHPSISASYNNIGFVYKLLGKNEQALDYYQKSVQIKLRALGDDHPDIALAYNNIGLLYRMTGKHAVALEYYMKSLEVTKKTHGEEHENVAISLSNIASVQCTLGRHDEALDAYQKVLKIQEKTYGPVHVDVAGTYSNIALVYKLIGRHDQALENHQKSLEITKAIFGGDHANLAVSYNNIGLLCKIAGKNEEALENYKEALRIQLKAFGADHPKVAIAYNNIGVIYKNLGRYDVALEYYQKDLEITLKVRGADHPEVATSFTNIGNVYKHLGRIEVALDYLQKSLAIKIKAYGEGHSNTGGSYYAVGDLYEQQERYAEALEMYTKAKDVYVKGFGDSHAKTKGVEEKIISVKSKIAT